MVVSQNADSVCGAASGRSTRLGYTAEKHRGAGPRLLSRGFRRERGDWGISFLPFWKYSRPHLDYEHECSPNDKDGEWSPRMRGDDRDEENNLV